MAFNTKGNEQRMYEIIGDRIIVLYSIKENLNDNIYIVFIQETDFAMLQDLFLTTKQIKHDVQYIFHWLPEMSYMKDFQVAFHLTVTLYTVYNSYRDICFGYIYIQKDADGVGGW